MAKGNLIQNVKVLLRIFQKARRSIISLKKENIALKKKVCELIFLKTHEAHLDAEQIFNDLRTLQESFDKKDKKRLH